MNQLAPRVPGALVEELFRKAAADRWGLTRDEFADVLNASLRHVFSTGEPSSRDLERYVSGLHVSDLALACACALGRDVAWDHFVLEHRPILYRAADSLDPTGGARELADTLYADLYGLKDGRKDGDAGRRSLFRYFHGRSSLATWLRAVLSQRHVDALRSGRRLEPLPEEGAAAARVALPDSDPDRAVLVPHINRALRAAVDRLPAKDRLRLRSYYVAQLTLAEIGRITAEHEGTVSRHLTRTRRNIKEAVVRHLQEESKLSNEQIARAFELAIEDTGEMDLERMFAPGDRKGSPPDRSK